MPVVPEDIFARLRQYQNIRGAEFSGWSPDGRGMLVRTRFGAHSLDFVDRIHRPPVLDFSSI